MWRLASHHSLRRDLLSGLTAALLMTELASAVAQPGVLKPGGQVTVAGVRVSAPPHWREVKPVSVRVRRVPVNKLPVPLMPGLKLATPVYAVSASETVLTADAGRFVVSLPIGQTDATRLSPLRLLTPQVDRAPGGGSSEPSAFWASDWGARVKGGFVEFDVTNLPADRELFFTAAQLD